MMGWRVGYLAYPLDLGGRDELGQQLLKVRLQDAEYTWVRPMFHDSIAR